MCELFGFSSAKKVKCNQMLEIFYSHGVDNPDGWGLAYFDANAVTIEKEPVVANESSYLKHRLTDDIVEDVLLAHIRKASRGGLEYKNCHPFSRRDASGRMWTLMHNGTIFQGEMLDAYVQKQKGSTDSERILYYLIDCINERCEKSEGSLTDKERFDTVAEMICTLAPENKLNLIIYDGELLYIHTNFYVTLHRLQKSDSILVSTKPLTSDEGWERVPMCTAFAYRQGKLVYEGEPHTHEFIDKEPRDSEYKK